MMNDQHTFLSNQILQNLPGWVSIMSSENSVLPDPTLLDSQHLPSHCRPDNPGISHTVSISGGHSLALFTHIPALATARTIYLQVQVLPCLEMSQNCHFYNTSLLPLQPNQNVQMFSTAIIHFVGTIRNLPFLKHKCSLDRWVQWLEHWPAHHRVAGLIPGWLPPAHTKWPPEPVRFTTQPLTLFTGRWSNLPHRPFLSLIDAS